MTARLSDGCNDEEVTSIPDFITHYHLADGRPFQNLSDLDQADLDSALSGLQITAESGVSERRLDPRHMKLRRTAEDALRTRVHRAQDAQHDQPPRYCVWQSLLVPRSLLRRRRGPRPLE